MKKKNGFFKLYLAVWIKKFVLVLKLVAKCMTNCQLDWFYPKPIVFFNDMLISPTKKILGISAIRLASSSINGTGRVEVYHRGRWGTVCGNIWTLSNAHVACRQLGYEGALAALCCALHGGGTGRVWLSDVSCSGKETSLQTCSHKGWGNNKCLHDQDATVVCNSHTSKGRKRNYLLRFEKYVINISN